MKKQNKNIISIIGATATGKSDLAIKLAQYFDTEIISADSRLVYKDFDIGTAKPTKEELNKVKHHCIDIVLPTDDFSVTEFREIAQNAQNHLFEQGKIPIVAGGTGFYIKSLLEGLDIPKVEADDAFRTEMRNIANEKGNEFLYNILKEKDEQIAQKLHYNDVFRVIRALEVIKKTGKKMSELQTRKTPDFNVIYIFLDAKERDFLYERINRRVDIMLEIGLIEEVKNLIAKYGKTISLLKTLGYKEISGYLDGEMSLDEAAELLKKNTKNFAKRQLTWFRAVKDTNKFYIDENSKEELFSRVKDKCISMM